MSGRSERVAAQDSDTGDPEATVYFTGTSGKHYHEDADCQYLKNSDPQEGTRAKAQSRWLQPCGRCVVTSEVSADE